MPLKETVFLTGFPGFIASRLLQRMASQRDSFLLLVQSQLLGQAREEVKRISNLTGRPLDNFHILQGDITEEGLGLSPREREFATSQTTILFHLAALYDLAVKQPAATAVNVEGTRNVNQFAQSIRGLQHYHYVSTCYVAGRRKGEIFETDLRHQAGFRNHYEESKYWAESEVENLKPYLPITIYRPSVVCGDSQTGETKKFDGVYYLINYLRKWPRVLSLFNIGNPDVTLNLVPIDFVVEAMAALSHDREVIGKTLQLADPNPLTTFELFNEIAICLNGSGSAVMIPGPLVEFVLTLPVSPAITGLPHHGVPYFFLKQQYDTSIARQHLEPKGIVCPPFPTYAKTIVDYAVSGEQ